MKTLLLATHNQGKAKEFATLLHGLVEEVKSAAEFGVPEPEETALSFSGNAILKAQHAGYLTGLPCLADDSGLCVDALKGAPGIYSARWAGPDKDFNMAMQRIHDELHGDVNGQPARFVALLALVSVENPSHPEIFQGVVEGHLVWPPRGNGGFGYDPMFQPNGFDQTFGEMDADQKHGISHRARAVAHLKEYLSSKEQ